jgi:hypothetical protein
MWSAMLQHLVESSREENDGPTLLVNIIYEHNDLKNRLDMNGRIGFVRQQYDRATQCFQFEKPNDSWIQQDSLVDWLLRPFLYGDGRFFYQETEDFSMAPFNLPRTSFVRDTRLLKMVDYWFFRMKESERTNNVLEFFALMHSVRTALSRCRHVPSLLWKVEDMVGEKGQVRGAC